MLADLHVLVHRLEDRLDALTDALEPVVAEQAELEFIFA